MHLRASRSPDLWAGLLFIAFGAIALWIAQDYPAGSARRMGPGYFPSLIACGLCAVGALLVLRGLVRDTEVVETVRARPFLVLVAIVLFAVLLEPAGLVIAAGTLILVGACASREFRLGEALVSAAVLIVFSVLVFISALGFPLSAFPRW